MSVPNMWLNRSHTFFYLGTLLTMDCEYLGPNCCPGTNTSIYVLHYQLLTRYILFIMYDMGLCMYGFTCIHVSVFGVSYLHWEWWGMVGNLSINLCNAVFNAMYCAMQYLMQCTVHCSV